MIADSKKGQFEAVMVHKGDRFARSRNLAREVRKGLLQKARNCLYTGGNLPLGYDVDPETQKFILAKNEDEIKTVQMIFRMKKENYGFTEIIRALEEKGLNKSKKGNPLSKSAINWLLHNERYTGLYIYDRLSAKGANGRNGHLFKNEDEMIRIEGGLPQIIDKQTFDEVQELMIKNRKRNGRFHKKYPVLLTGLLECECGYSYFNCYRKERPGHKAYSSYHCSYKSSHKIDRCNNKGIEQTSLDDAVLDLLYKHFYEDITTITQKLNDYRQEKIDSLGADLQTLKKQITANEIKVKNIVEAIAQGMSNPAMFDRIEELELERDHLENKLDEASKVENTAAISEDEVRSILEKTKELVRTKNIPEVQRFIHKYIHKVVVHKESVKVTFNVAFSFCGKSSATYRFTKELGREELKDRQYQIRKAV